MKQHLDSKTGLIFRLAVAFVLVSGLTACGAKAVRGESPFLKINALRLDQDTVHVDLGLRNINDEPLEIDNIDFVLTSRDTVIADFNAPRRASVIANGSETLRFDLPASRAGAGLLNGLQDGDIESLPYLVEGSIRTVEGKNLDLKGRGHIYPVPGRPGQFR